MNTKNKKFKISIEDMVEEILNSYVGKKISIQRIFLDCVEKNIVTEDDKNNLFDISKDFDNYEKFYTLFGNKDFNKKQIIKMFDFYFTDEFLNNDGGLSSVCVIKSTRYGNYEELYEIYDLFSDKNKKIIDEYYEEAKSFERGEIMDGYLYINTERNKYNVHE